MAKYRTKIERFGHPAGTIVYDAGCYDYSLAADDTRLTGVEHVSVTLNSSGGYPFFTIPKRQLDKAED